MDTVSAAKELLTDPRIWPWLILATILYTLQGAASKWLEHQVGKISAEAVYKFGWTLLVFLLLFHATLSAGSCLWCLIRTDEPAPVLQSSGNNPLGRALGYGMLVFLSAMPLASAAIWSLESRNYTVDTTNSSLFGLITKSLVCGIVLSFIFWSIRVPGSTYDFSSIRSANDAALWYIRVSELSMPLSVLVGIPSAILKLFWHLSSRL